MLLFAELSRCFALYIEENMSVKNLLLLFSCIASIAYAQHVPNGPVGNGQVLTPAQWNTAWQDKVDVTNGLMNSPTFRGLAQGTIAPTGTLPNTTYSYTPLAWALASPSDNAADTTGNGSNIPSLALIQQFYGGSNINDGRNGLSVFTDLMAPTSASNAYRYYVGISSYSKAQTSDNGTGASPQGVVEAVTGSSQLTAGATNYFGLIGAEFTLSAATGSSVAKKAILNLDEWPTDTVQGSVIDSYIWSTAHTGAVGMNTWSQLDANAGVFPLTTSGTVIKLIGTSTIATGLDFGALTVSGNVLQWHSGTYSLSGSGNAKLNAIIAGGTTFTVSGCGTAGSVTGGATAGSFIVGTGAAPCAFTITMGGGVTATHGWVCTAYDVTKNLPLSAAGISTGSCVITSSINGTNIAVATRDLIQFSARGY
jgi:hypothetical protein